MNQHHHLIAEALAYLEGGHLAVEAYRAGVIAEAVERGRLRAHATPHAPCPAQQPSAWPLRRPERFHGYTEPLFEALRTARAAGEPCPNAREIVRLWAARLPWEVVEATPEGIKYQQDTGGVRFADLDAIGKAIKRMTA